MTVRDYQLIRCAIDNCENREKKTCEQYARLNPTHRKRIEANRDMFLFATMMVRMEIDRMIEEDNRRLKGLT
jgi:KaiC/GvpD/RAD55 family RecA-like ATPase